MKEPNLAIWASVNLAFAFVVVFAYVFPMPWLTWIITALMILIIACAGALVALSYVAARDPHLLSLLATRPFWYRAIDFLYDTCIVVFFTLTGSWWWALGYGVHTMLLDHYHTRVVRLTRG